MFSYCGGVGSSSLDHAAVINGWCPGRIIVLSTVSISRHIMASAAVASCCHGRRTLLALPRAFPQPGGKTLKIWPEPYRLAGEDERGSRPIDKEIVVFERASDPACSSRVLRSLHRQRFVGGQRSRRHRVPP
jgi:hypothetical protein